MKCSARDRWIGWDFRHRYDRLKLLANNSRFLILPDWHIANLGSRILSMCQKRLPADWQAIFDRRLLLLETFVDPQRFRGTIYKAANWIYVGDTKSFFRTCTPGTLPVADSDEIKRTNEIKTAIPLLDAIDIQDKDITADALLTQRHIADYLVRQRNAHYHFTVENNQPGLFQDIALFFNNRKSPDFILTDTPDHVRIEIRKIWTTTELNVQDHIWGCISAGTCYVRQICKKQIKHRQKCK